MTEQYKLSPENKNSIYTTEHWWNMLSDDSTPVTVLRVQVWRSGIFGIELDESDKERLLAQDDTIVLNDYGVSVDELYSGEFVKYEILNADTYSEEQMEEIRNMMFGEDGEEEFDEDIMEANDWSMDDTIYEVTGGVELELESE